MPQRPAGPGGLRRGREQRSALAAHAPWESRLADAGEVQLVVYDVSGAVLRRLVSGWQAPGGHSAAWDGRDEGGQPVASGLYLGCLESGPMRQVQKLMLLK